MMNCEQITRSVSDFLDRKLRFRDRVEFLMHIAMCGGCRAYFEQMKLTIRGMHSLNQLAEAGAGVDALLEHFREETKRKERCPG